MDIKVQNKNERALLHRTDYTVRVFAEGATPSRGKLIDKLAKELKGKKELLVVRRINQTFGDSVSLIDVSVYADEASLTEFEQAHMKTRHEKAMPKKEEAPVAEAADPEPAPAAEEKAPEEKKEAEE